ncbi:MAG: ATP-binding protein [Thermosynechococcaceae cyanobacterium]
MALETGFFIQRSELRVETDLDVMSRVVKWFDQFDRPPLTHRLWLEAQIALIEGFTNAVRHAHQHLHETTPIELDVQVSPQFFQLCIWDQGNPFDFELKLQRLHHLINSPDFDPFTHETRWGGIMFLKLRLNYGWHISYDRPMVDRNCLRVEKLLSYPD